MQDQTQAAAVETPKAPNGPCNNPRCACGPTCQCGDACVCTPQANCAD
ncbi:hypothetical protein [Phenylobacterium aquaticum]|nr:hypothetical protein [Phenylobacterium aquaticum]MCI3135226.1 hypothetical protein [Phenylobacterium aquaticum]